MSTPLLQNILGQPEAVRLVAQYQGGAGQKNLLQAAELLQPKKRILFSGMGASYFACLPLYYRLLQRGWEVMAAETSELLYCSPSSFDSDTAVVLVSRSGESVEVTKLLPLLKQRRSAIIGIVNVPDSTLSSEADATIVMNSPADQFAAIQSYTATLIVMTLLEAAILNEWAQAKTELETTTELLAGFVPECVKASQEWLEFLHGDQPLYLLGRGPSLGAVFEGALLMHEVGKSPAIGMSTSQFRHGPVEVVDGAFRAIVIGTFEKSTHLDASLAEDIGKMGGQARWIGPVIEDKKIVPLCSWPDQVPSRFSCIFETVPLQMAAYRKAEIRGLRPGDFRWAPLVTTSEEGFNIPQTHP